MVVTLARVWSSTYRGYQFRPSIEEKALHQPVSFTRTGVVLWMEIMVVYSTKTSKVPLLNVSREHST
jgi:hypothetical protein